MADEQHPAWPFIEQGAQLVVGARDVALGPGEHAIELSKAISLKRLADDMNGIRVSLMALTQAVAGDPLNSGIRHTLNDIAIGVATR